MAEYSATQTVDVEAKKLFAYLSEVDNLPDYFPRITAARRTDDDRIEVAASVPDGEGGKREEQGEAWLRVEQADTTLVWGSAGPNSYEGRLDLDPLGDDSCTLTVAITTDREDADADRMQQGVDEAVQGVKEAAERFHS